MSPNRFGITRAEGDSRGREAPCGIQQVVQWQVSPEVMRPPTLFLQHCEHGHDAPFVPLTR
jgi:hypothetical protein